MHVCETGTIRETEKELKALEIWCYSFRSVEKVCSGAKMFVFSKIAKSGKRFYSNVSKIKKIQ